ncbi:MAG: CDP-diacylglycerol--glycerol-3-phosphate 3-phosphatidyltransferase [Alyxoria varia]|nr:MAG: CDP-diacylglycerol--glycerol-3-phosphate 3-phosphatidyltransferase [Alyxoria varia]
MARSYSSRSHTAASLSTSSATSAQDNHATSASGDGNESQESLNQPDHQIDQQNQPNQGGLADFKSVTDQLDGIAPRFEVDAEQIEILREPKDFYGALKDMISKAERRIFISTLYIGKTEHDLINTIRASLQRNPNLTISFLTDYLRGTREAPEPCCASLLAPLISEFGPERVRVRMWHTPNLTGLRKSVLPKRINEGWGLQHMKIYGVDDEVMLSGANLSSDYFTNRQDRYHIFRSQCLTDYYSCVHTALGTLSFDLQPSSSSPSGFTILWPDSSSCPAPNVFKDPKGYVKAATRLLAPLVRPSAVSGRERFRSSAADDAHEKKSEKTIVYPIFQFAPLFPKDTGTARETPDDAEAGLPGPSSSSSGSSYSTELPALTLLLNSLKHAPFSTRKTHWTFTAGYFNMTDTIRDLLLSSLSSSATTPSLLPASTRSPPQNRPTDPHTNTNTSNPRPTTTATILTAHPHANGFFGSSGLSGLLPSAYTHLARKFLEEAARRCVSQRLELREWRRGVVGEEGGWSYHAKGFWVSVSSPGGGRTGGVGDTSTGRGAGTDGETGASEEPYAPSITLIGSSNYTQRSHTLDTEANALIVTADPGLQRRLGEEVAHLKKYAGEPVHLGGSEAGKVGREGGGSGRGVDGAKVDGNGNADAENEKGIPEFDKPSRKVNWRVKFMMWVVKVVGGAL